MLPLADSLECVELTTQDIREAHGQHVAHVRGELVPYIRLSEYFQMKTPRPEREQIMVVATERGHYGFVVDEVLGDHQTVIKNLGRLYRNVQVVSGATILGDGTVALIVDPHRLVQSVVESANSKSRHNRGAGKTAFKTEVQKGNHKQWRVKRIREGTAPAAAAAPFWMEGVSARTALRRRQRRRR